LNWRFTRGNDLYYSYTQKEYFTRAKRDFYPDATPIHPNALPCHEVTVSSFFLGRFAITQKQWRAISALPPINRELKPDPSFFKGDNRPVEQVS
jgi:formylglycine-generating enzyme required for sulfatase activity